MLSSAFHSLACAWQPLRPNKTAAKQVGLTIHSSKRNRRRLHKWSLKITVLARLRGVTSLTTENQKKQKMHWTEKSEKPPSLLTKKNENERLNWREPEDRARHQNRKTAVYLVQKPKNRTKIYLARSAKTKIPTPSYVWECNDHR